MHNPAPTTATVAGRDDRHRAPLSALDPPRGSRRCAPAPSRSRSRRPPTSSAGRSSASSCLTASCSRRAAAAAGQRPDRSQQRTRVVADTPARPARARPLFDAGVRSRWLATREPPS